MKIILSNGAELTPITVTGGKRTVQGATRDTLSFVFPADMGMENLDALFSAENCESVTIVEDNGASYIHNAYTVRAELSKKSEIIQAETADTPAVYEDRITVAMSQRTYMETQLASMQAALAQMQSA